MALSFDIPRDFDIIVSDIGKSFKKVTVAETLDTYGRMVTAVRTTSTITAIILPVTSEDERLVGAGWVDYGDFIGYFKATDGIDEHMEIDDGSTVFEVIVIPDETEVSGSAPITRVGLKKRTE